MTRRTWRARWPPRRSRRPRRARSPPPSLSSPSSDPSPRAGRSTWTPPAAPRTTSTPPPESRSGSGRRLSGRSCRWRPPRPLACHQGGVPSWRRTSQTASTTPMWRRRRRSGTRRPTLSTTGSASWTRGARRSGRVANWACLSTSLTADGTGIWTSGRGSTGATRNTASASLSRSSCEWGCQGGWTRALRVSTGAVMVLLVGQSFAVSCSATTCSEGWQRCEAVLDRRRRAVRFVFL
mmetsp:Transcript_74288/g.234635  ORF Transcript_74288/g.234635 Transcript_74288/m.234635 type:complete len:237 (-) Transcript_74288:265-975(-)